MRKYLVEMNLNWENAEDYDYIDQLSLEQLAFEFLRRNSEYQKDFQLYSEALAALHDKHGPNPQDWWTDTRAWICDPPMKEGETLGDWKKRAANHNSEPHRVWFEEWYRRKWGIVEGVLPDPATILEVPLEFDNSLGFPIAPNFLQIGSFFVDDDGDDGTKEPDGQIPGYCVLAFDLRASIKQQILVAKEILKAKHEVDKGEAGLRALQKKQTSNFHTQFKIYLRLLDAETAGAERSKMGGCLFGYAVDSPDSDIYYKSKKVSDNLGRARFFRDFNYRVIPTW